MLWVAGFQGFQQAAALCDQDRVCRHKSGTCDHEEPINRNTTLAKLPIDIRNAVLSDIDSIVITWSKIIALNKDGCIIPPHNLGLDSVSKRRLIKVTNVGEKLAFISTCGKIYVSDFDTCNEVKLQDVNSQVRDIKATEDKLVVLHDQGVSCVSVPCQLNTDPTICLHLESHFPSLSIKSVSCGKEHTLLLSNGGVLYSFGGGSRGQLGHGDIESRIKPEEIKSLTGVRMLSVAAGGWHSAAISEYGDVYVWGWNESGQLGLPCKGVSGNREISRHAQPTKSKECSTKSNMNETASATQLGTLDDDRATDAEKESASVIQTSDRAPKTDIYESASVVQTSDRAPKTDIYESASVIQTSDTTSVIQTSDTTSVIQTSDTTSNIDIHESASVIQTSDTTSVIQTSDTTSNIDIYESQIFVQDLEPIQVQPYPCILDLLESIKIIQIACGSRHTVLMTDSGYLLSCGWNDYGQLCHGDTQSRDFLQTIDFFIRKNIKVTNVICGYWNTVIVSSEMS